MKNKKSIAIFLIFIIIFNMIAPFNCVFGKNAVELEKDIKVTKGFQYYSTQLILNIADAAYKLIGKAVKQEVTIDRLIFNEIDAVNANFFDGGGSSADNSVTAAVKNAINKGYNTFRNLAILVYVIAIVGIAIKVLLEGTPLSKAKAKDVAVKWFTGILLLFLFPYVMKYAFELNKAVLKQVKDSAVGKRETMDIAIGGEEDYSEVEVEYRSPAYVSKYTGIVGKMGESEKNTLYLTSIEEYKASADVMKLMYSYARITGSYIYTFLWLILVWQTIVLLVLYYKRFFVIAVLIIIFPVVTIFYVADTIIGRSPAGFSRWCTEFFTNVFTQSIHAVTYALSAGIIISQIKKQVGGEATSINVVLMIIAVSFIFRGEKIIRKIIGGDRASSITSAEDQSKSVKGGPRKIRGNFSKVRGSITK